MGRRQARGGKWGGRCRGHRHREEGERVDRVAGSRGWGGAITMGAGGVDGHQVARCRGQEEGVR